MKNIQLIIALALALGLASCGNQPNSSNAINNGNNNEAGATVSETPFEWSFDLMWDIFMMKPFGYQLDEEDTVRLVRERAKRSYDAQTLKNTLRIHTIDLTYCFRDTDVVCFKYDELDKLFVFFLVYEDCEPPCNYSSYSYSYDLNEKTITEVECPIMPLEVKDFLEGLLLLDCSADQLSEMKPVEDCEEFRFMKGSENADLLVQSIWLEGNIKCRANVLAFDWNGHEFVRKPEADVLGTTILEDGFCTLPFDSEIPSEIPGYDIEPQTYMAEGEEQIKYAVKKGDELLMEIEPGFDFGKMEFTKTVDVINVYSDRYQNAKHFHVGSNVSDVLAAYSDLLTSLTAMGDICLDADGTQFMVAPEDYDGKLPEITSDEGAIIKNPTFKPEAKVKMIRLYNSK